MPDCQCVSESRRHRDPAVGSLGTAPTPDKRILDAIDRAYLEKHTLPAQSNTSAISAVRNPGRRHLN
jgi:hypothetical protein